MNLFYKFWSFPSLLLSLILPSIFSSKATTDSPLLISTENTKMRAVVEKTDCIRENPIRYFKQDYQCFYPQVGRVEELHVAENNHDESLESLDAERKLAPAEKSKGEFGNSPTTNISSNHSVVYRQVPKENKLLDESKDNEGENITEDSFSCLSPDVDLHWTVRAIFQDNLDSSCPLKAEPDIEPLEEFRCGFTSDLNYMRKLVEFLPQDSDDYFETEELGRRIYDIFSKVRQFVKNAYGTDHWKAAVKNFNPHLKAIQALQLERSSLLEEMLRSLNELDESIIEMIVWSNQQLRDLSFPKSKEAEECDYARDACKSLLQIANFREASLKRYQNFVDKTRNLAALNIQRKRITMLAQLHSIILNDTLVLHESFVRNVKKLKKESNNTEIENSVWKYFILCTVLLIFVILICYYSLDVEE